MREAFERLVEEIVILGHDVGEEDVRGFAAKFQRNRNDVLRRILHDQPAGRRLAGEGNLRNPLALCQRLSGFDAKAVYDVEDAGGQQIADQLPS